MQNIRKLIASVLVSIFTMWTNSVYSDPANPPGLELMLEGKLTGEIHRYLNCHGLLTLIEYTLPIDSQDWKKLENNLKMKFGKFISVSVGDTEHPSHLAMHEHVSKITTDQHPDAVLTLHTFHHMLEECVSANGLEKLEGNSPGEWVREPVCAEFDDFKRVIQTCYDKVLPEINARHPWEIQFVD